MGLRTPRECHNPTILWQCAFFILFEVMGVVYQLSRDHFLYYLSIKRKHLQIVVKPHEVLQQVVIVPGQHIVEVVHCMLVEQHDTGIVAILDSLTEDVLCRQCGETRHLLADLANQIIKGPCNDHI